LDPREGEVKNCIRWRDVPRNAKDGREEKRRPEEDALSHIFLLHILAEMLIPLEPNCLVVRCLDLKRVAAVARPLFLEVNLAAVVEEINVLYKDRFRAEAPML
jgi:hypothetical protein